MKILKYFLILLIFLTIPLWVGLSIKGQKGVPIYFQNEKDTRVGGPFESSNNNSRYALTEAIVEDRTFFFNDMRARFATPDIEEYNGKIFSIFTPGVSFLGSPFYLLGKLIGFPQLLTYSSTAILALVNFLLIILLSRKLGAGFYSSLLGGIVFLIGTNALAYALTFTQHHASVTLILLALLNIIGERTFLKNIFLGALFGTGLLVDVPNGITMLPIIMYALFKHLRTESFGEKIRLGFKLNIIGLLIGLIPLLAVFGWYNYKTTGSYFKVAQLLGRRVDILPTGEIVHRRQIIAKADETPKLPFNPRNQLRGSYILLVSNERSWLFYSPVVLLGILGMILAYRQEKKRSLAIVASSVVLITVVAYSMFGDPWGGWSFGPRYLIPAAAILCAAMGIVIQKYRKNFIFISMFFVLIIYSLAVSTIGAMTTNAIPPKVEAVNLPNPIPYTYEYNLQLIDKNFTSSLIYNLYLFKIMSAKEFLYIYYASTLMVIVGVYLFVFFDKKKTEKLTGEKL